MNSIDRNITIGIFIDGGYMSKIDDELRLKFSVKINIRELFAYVKQKLSELYKVDVDDCHIVESHYFRERMKAEDSENKELLFKERQFEDRLIENDVIFHYKHLQETGEQEKELIERGMDVWFALEAYERAINGQFDINVLLTADAAQEMLEKKLKTLKSRVVLLTWDLGGKFTTANLLSNEASKHIDMSVSVENDPKLRQRICTRIIDLKRK